MSGALAQPDAVSPGSTPRGRARIVLAGFGTVGRSVARVLQDLPQDVELVAVLDRRATMKRVDWLDDRVLWTESLDEALAAGADIVLLDNMPLERLREAAALCKGKALTEASGGVNETTIRAIAETGVDLISVGAITHSVTALDISLDWC